MTSEKRTRRQKMSTPHGELRSPWDELGATGRFQAEPCWSLRWLLYSYPGRGKTTLATSIPRNLILDCEDKAGGVDYAHGTRRLLCRSFDNCLAALKLLEEQSAADKREFQLVTIDSLPEFIRLATDHLSNKYRAKISALSRSIEDYGEGGKGHRLVNNEVIGFLGRLYFAGYGWLCTAHLNSSRGRNSDGEEIMVPELTVKPGVLKYLLAQAHFTGQIVSRVSRQHGDRRYLCFDLESNTTPTRTPFPLVSDGQDVGRIELPLLEASQTIERLYDESAERFAARIQNRDVRIATPLSHQAGQTGQTGQGEEESTSKTPRRFKRKPPKEKWGTP